MPITRLPGPITGDLEGDLAVAFLVAAVMLLLRLVDKKLGGPQRLGAFFVGVGLLSVAVALFVDMQRAIALPYVDAPVDYERAAIGQTLYNQHCMGCHGMTGHGDGHELADMRKPAPDLTVHIFQHDETFLYAVIGNGLGAMPGFKDRLLSSQIGDVIQYIRVLGRKN